jgi:putative transposase
MRPEREVATSNGQTYFVTSNTAARKPFFRHERWGRLFIETLYGYRPERFTIHGFVIMPDHFHVLMTPRESLERAVQCVKGGFSFRAKRELGWVGDVWIAGFSDHRIRDEEDFEVHRRYMAVNPVKAGLCGRAEEYAFSSANGMFELDEFPRGLKPGFRGVGVGAAKAAPLQNSAAGDGVVGVAPVRYVGVGDGVVGAAPLQSIAIGDGVVGAAPLQNIAVDDGVVGVASFRNMVGHDGAAKAVSFQNIAVGDDAAEIFTSKKERLDATQE